MMRTNLVRVPAFVRYLVLETVSVMEFYIFHEMFCPILNKDEKLRIPIIARPLTLLSGFPKDFSMASFGDKVYIIGGSTLPRHLINLISLDPPQYDVKEIMEHVNDKTKKLLTEHSNNLKSLVDSDSNIVKRLQFGKLLNSLFENGPTKKVVVGELDDDEASNDSPMYWETCPSMSKCRRHAHLLRLGDRLYAIGGNADCKQTSLIEVFDQGVWTPLWTENPPDIDPYLFVSAANEESNIIFIGSKSSFYLLHVMDVGNGKVKGLWNKLLCECPSKLLRGCFQRPGIVTNKHYVLWWDDSNSCIYGFNPFSSKYFIVNLTKKILGFAANGGNIIISNLIDLGKGILCLFYREMDIRKEGNVYGVRYYVCTHHCVTFEINYDHLSEIEAIMSFPGIELEISVITHYKCYAPANAEDNSRNKCSSYGAARTGNTLGLAFALDIHIPLEKKTYM